MFAYTTDGQTRVLRATRTLVAKRGYADVSLRDIAANAGYSPAGVYAHFRSRDAILDALADGVRAELYAELKKGASVEAQAADRLVNIGFAYVEFARLHPAEFELLFRWTRSRRRGRTDRRQSPFDLLKNVARQVHPEASEDEIELACLGLWTVAHGLACLRASHLASFSGDWNQWGRQLLRAQVEGALCASR